jgi:hypothetical protein
MYKAISKHVIQRYLDRGLRIDRIYRDLETRNLKKLITRPDGTKILFTKNKLRFVIKENVVITVMKIRSHDVKRELKKYGYL